jgi:diacylglycerol kinase family enzyme
MVSNSLSIGGFKHMTGKRVKLDDGLFEVTLIKKPQNPIELNNLANALLSRSFDAETMYWFRTAKLTITASEALPWTLDGEFGGYHSEITIYNGHKALKILR